MINELKEKEVFIFGSNKNGNHLGGAAKQAYDNFGAKWGIGEGLIGKSYAFPTLNKEMKKVSKSNFMLSICKLFDCCNENKDKKFLMTKIGCGIAGFGEREVQHNLDYYEKPDNLIMPDDWI